MEIISLSRVPAAQDRRQQRALWRAPARLPRWPGHRPRRRRHDGLVPAMARDNHGAQQLENDLRTCSASATCRCCRSRTGKRCPTTCSARTRTSSRSASPRCTGCRRSSAASLVVPVQTLMQRLPPLRYVVGNTLDVKVGQRLDLDAEKRRLEAAGYRNVPQVLDPGDFAVRGALLDVYPMGADVPLPHRTVRRRDRLDPQLRPGNAALARQGRAVQLLPGREVPLDDASAQARAARRCANASTSTPRRSALYQDLKAGGAPAGIEYYLPLFFEQTATLFDYLGAAMRCRCSAKARSRPPTRSGRRPASATSSAATTSSARCCRRTRSSCRRTSCANGLNQVRAHRSLRRDASRARTQAIALGDQPAPMLPWLPRAPRPRAALQVFLASYPGRVLIAADSAGRREALLEVLQAGRAAAGTCVAGLARVRRRERASASRIAVAPLDDGFALTRAARCARAHRAPAVPRTRRADRAAASAPAANPKRSSATSAKSPTARRSCTRTTASAVTAAWSRSKPAACPANTSRSSTPRATSCTCRWRSCTWSAAIPAPRRKPRRCIRSAASSGTRPSARPPRRCATSPPNCSRSRPSARRAPGSRCEVDRAMYEPFAATFPFEETPDQPRRSRR